MEAFYAYWVRFESWRDFDLETQTNEIHEEMDRRARGVPSCRGFFSDVEAVLRAGTRSAT